MSLYDSENGSGNLLSTGTLTQTIVKDQANTVDVTFNGVAASLSLSVGSASAGTSTTVPVTLKVLDSDGNTIIGPGSYVNASGNALSISVANSDTSGATTLSQTTVSAPLSTLTLAYTGLAILPTTITASANGLTNSTASFAPTLQPIGPSSLTGGVYVNIDGASPALTFTASEVGWTNAPYDQPLTATPSAACSTFGTVTPSSGTTFTASLVPQSSSGSCTLTLSDGVGQQLLVPLGYELFFYTGADQDFVVPSGVTQATVRAVGASGSGSAGLAGYGAIVTAQVSLSGTIIVKVGSPGGSYAQGYVYGGGAPPGSSSDQGYGGGGLSGIFNGSTPLLIAGGGGGSGYGPIAGGNGGNPGSAGANVAGVSGAFGGGGGQLTIGGTGGSAQSGCGPCTPGANGSYLTGGSGSGQSPYGAGGGGGGGYYGGGGGGSGDLFSGGGGGGSSYIASTLSTPIYSTATNYGTGAVTVAW